MRRVGSGSKFLVRRPFNPVRRPGEDVKGYGSVVGGNGVEIDGVDRVQGLEQGACLFVPGNRAVERLI